MVPSSIKAHKGFPRRGFISQGMDLWPQGRRIQAYCVQFFIGTIRAYQRIRALFSICSCRFHPSCSQYAIDALNKHGLFLGTAKSIWRIMRCSPLSKGGYDPVR